MTIKTMEENRKGTVEREKSSIIAKRKVLRKNNKMKPTNPNAHTYVEDNGDKVSIMIRHENVNVHTYRRTVEQHHCSESVFSPRQQHWRRNAVARGKQRLPRHGSHARRTYHT